MTTIFFGIFLVLHGLVHLLYTGQSWRFFELRPNMIWPDEAWIFSKILSVETIRLMASISLALATLGFITGGLGLFLRADWWRWVTAISAAFSSLLFFVFWNGKFQAMDDQGGVVLLINLAILVVILIFKWPV